MARRAVEALHPTSGAKQWVNLLDKPPQVVVRTSIPAEGPSDVHTTTKFQVKILVWVAKKFKSMK